MANKTYCFFLALSLILAQATSFYFFEFNKIKAKYLSYEEKLSCRWKNPNVEITPVIKNPLRLLSERELPQQWLWNNVNGTSFLTFTRNQHIPQYCGACWAFAATSALSDRIKIRRNASWDDIIIAPQVLLSCSQENNGCHGGYGLYGYNYIHKNNITDDSCAPYRARGHDNGYKCANTTICKDCPGGEGGDCFLPPAYNIYGVEEFGAVTGEVNMLNEIYQRGPIVCGIAVPGSLRNYTGGIYNDTTGDTDIVHEVSVVGYGVERGVKYWLVRNSWGTYWGEDGYFKVVRGVNNIGIESECSFAVPRDTWTNKERHYTTQAERDDPKNDYENSPDWRNKTKKLKFLEEQMVSKEILSYEGFNYTGEVIPPTLSLGERNPRFLNFNLTDVPESHDWRNYKGHNWLSHGKNQHIPGYCGSCWAHATSSALADRFNILNGKNSTTVSLSPQVLVNCKPGTIKKSTCHGGSPLDVYEFIFRNGLPDDSCQQYIALDPSKSEGVCTGLEVCEDCTPPIPKEGESGRNQCKPISNYRRYYVSSYGRIPSNNSTAIKYEIFKNGPVDCMIDSTTNFHQNYTGFDIYSEKVDSIVFNHVISLVGYGKENGVEFWIGRNSWGSYWGNQGFFRIKMHTDNLGVEGDCHYAIPSYRSHYNPKEETQ